jgi:dienelactone hydrolase
MEPSPSTRARHVDTGVGDGGRLGEAGVASATPRLQVDQPGPLVDQPVGLVITGCEPGEPVVVHAQLDDGAASYEAEATFDADGSGRVDTARSTSRAGTYEGIDPFGLWWSGTPVGPSTSGVAASMQCQVTVEASHRSAEAAVERRWLAAGATVGEVREPGVWGIYARPGGPGPFPAVVAFGGSGGGLGPAAAWAPMLASHGFAVLAIAYFGVPGLPASLVGIEVETVERAVSWLRGRSEAAADTVAVMGMSRGSELALLASTLLDHVGPVVAFAPSGVSWAGLDAGGPVDAPAWTFRGDPIPHVPIGAGVGAGQDPSSTEPLALRSAFERALRDEVAIGGAEIPVERAKGPILMVSGEDDAMWPSATMGEIARRRAAGRGFAHDICHLRYPDAGHICGGVPGTPIILETRHPMTGGYYSFGGSRAGNAAARADSWPQVLAFLSQVLRAESRQDQPVSQ